MSIQTYKKSILSSDKQIVVTNQEVTSRNWKFGSIFKLLAGIIYGVFFGMLPATFLKNGVSVTDPGYHELGSIIGLFSTSILSIAIIFWTFKGDIKKKYPLVYNLVHLLNSLLLAATMIVVTILEAKSTIDGAINVNRYGLLGISSVAWAFIMAIMIISVLAFLRHQYPLSWSKAIFALVSLIIASAGEIFMWLSARADKDHLGDQSKMWALIGLAALVVSIIVFALGLVFVKRFREVLLGQRTEYELDAIRDWESSRLFALVMSAAMIITYTVFIFIGKTDKIEFTKDIILFIEIGIDFVLVIPYIIIISVIKASNFKKSNKSFISSRVFKTIDNGLLLDVIGWIIVVKAALIEGILISSTKADVNVLRALILTISFGSILLLYGFTIVIQANVPNLRNTAMSLPIIIFSLLLAVFVILFSGYLYREDLSTPLNSDVSGLVFEFLALFVLVGMSISLITKICMVARIFKTNWNKTEEETVDKSNLIKEEEGQENDLIGARTKDIDLDKIKKAKESSSQATMDEQIKSAISEGVKG